MLVADVAVLLLTWSACAAVLVGLGSVVMRAAPRAGTVGEAFWVGLAAAVAILQAWHLLLPVNAAATITLAAGGCLGLYGSGRGREAVRAVRQAGPVAVALFGGLCLAVAVEAAGPCNHYDTKLYGAATVDWLKAYPVVPGLANLHGRLGFNSAAFLLLAAVDHGPWAGRSQHLLVGLVCLGLLGPASVAVGRVVAAGRAARADWFLAALGLPVGCWALSSASSMNTDAPAGVMCLAGVHLLYRHLTAEGETPGRPPEDATRLLVAMVVLAACVPLKLSTAAFAGTGWVLAFVAVLRLPAVPGRRRLLASAVVASAALVLPWLVRGCVLSGYPLYPSRAISFPCDWRATRSSLFDSAWIRSWARTPGATLDLTRGLAWVPGWARRATGDRLDFGTPALLAGAAVAVLAFLGRRGSRARSRPAGGQVLMPAGLALAVWFVAAPDLRFAGYAIWTGVAFLVATAATAPATPRTGVDRLVVTALALLFCWCYDPRQFVHDVLRGPGDWDLHATAVVPFTTADGLVVYRPAEGDWTCRSPLLTTPYPDAGLRLRRPGNVGGGFSTRSVPEGDYGFEARVGRNRGSGR